MTMPCDDIRELLLDYLYEEIEGADADRVRAHLEECRACAARLEAFGSVRQDLARLEEIETPGSPARIAFVAPPAAARRTGGTASAWLRTAAVAASFVLGLFLTAAAVNFQVHADDDGWTVRTSLWPAAATGTDGGVADATGAAAVPATGADDDARAADNARAADEAMTAGAVDDRLSNWLDRELSRRGLVLTAGRPDDTGPGSAAAPPSGNDPEGTGLTAAQRDDVNAILTRLLDEHRRAMSEDFQQLVAASELSQQQQFRAALASLYEALELQHAESYLTIASELGPVLLDTGERLDQADAAIDYLITQVGARREDGADPRPER